MPLQVQEYLPGGDLFSVLDPGTGMAENVLFYYARQVAEALVHLHGLGIAHRDIKCEHIVMTWDRRQVKLIDFGCSVYVTQGPCERHHVGTLSYLAPELTEEDTGENKVQHLDLLKCDVFAFGVVLLVCATGNFLWKDPNVLSHFDTFLEFLNTIQKRSTCPSDKLATLLNAMLTTHHEHRWTSKQVADYLCNNNTP